MRVIALALLAGCYAPELQDGLPCSDTYGCPEGQSCDVATQTCFVSLPDSRVFHLLSVGRDHACGIVKAFTSDPGGALWCWGANGDRQLGNDGPSSLGPIRVGGDDDWAAVSAGDRATIGIRADGTMWAWGEGSPMLEVGAGTQWREVSVGYNDECALDVDGAMSCHLLDGIMAFDDGPWATLQADDERVCALDPDDRLFCWGLNNSGEIGDGTTDYVNAPFEVMPGARFVDLATGIDHTCAVRDDGAAFCWGDCQRGQLGDGRDPRSECNDLRATPTQVLGDGYTQISSFEHHTCARRSDRTVWCWGVGDLGGTGAGVEIHADPRPVLGNNWNVVVAGSASTCALDSNGATFCWGPNGLGQLGDGNGGDVRTPEQVAAGGLWAEVRAGDRSTCAIEVNGSLWCWGRNGRGELGIGHTRQADTPTQVGDDIGWEDVSVGRDHGCGILGGFLRCWGAQDQRADGAVLLEPFEPPTAGPGWTSIAAATSTTCAIKGVDDAAELWCWGVGGQPQRIGTDTGWSSLTSDDGPEISDSTICALRGGRAYCMRGDPLAPVAQATNVTDFQKLSTGFSHACGLDAEGAAWCWGTNGYGELGTDAVTESVDAIRVEGFGGLREISAGLNVTCAIETDSDLWCWGSNASGTLGDGSAVTASFEPVQLTGTDWYAVSASRDHACALREDDTLWCWGSDDTDQLGRGLGGSTTPVRVLP